MVHTAHPFLHLSQIRAPTCCRHQQQQRTAPGWRLPVRTLCGTLTLATRRHRLPPTLRRMIPTTTQDPRCPAIGTVSRRGGLHPRLPAIMLTGLRHLSLVGQDRPPLCRRSAKMCTNLSSTPQLPLSAIPTTRSPLRLLPPQLTRRCRVLIPFLWSPWGTTSGRHRRHLLCPTM